MFSLLADPLTVLGPRRADAMTTRSDALVALGKVLDPRAKKHPQLQSTALTVAVSPGGRSAWAFDVVRFEGHTIAAIAILSNTSDLWSVTTAALAMVPTAARAKTESARDAIVPPGSPPGASPGATAGKTDPGAARVVDDWKKGLLDQDSWGTELMSQSDAIYAGPTAGQVAHGKQAIRQLWKARTRANVREAVSGEITARVTPDGQLAWLSAPVTRVADGEDPLPLRAFAVYEKDGAAWRLIVLHEGIAIDEPGSGTALKKIVPAAPAPPKAEPARPDDKKPSDSATAKARPAKKRKKPAPRSDDP